MQPDPWEDVLVTRLVKSLEGTGCLGASRGRGHRGGVFAGVQVRDMVQTRMVPLVMDWRRVGSEGLWRRTRDR